MATVGLAFLKVDAYLFGGQFLVQWLCSPHLKHYVGDIGLLLPKCWLPGQDCFSFDSSGDLAWVVIVLPALVTA